jgi:hypothetical protein
MSVAGPVLESRNKAKTAHAQGGRILNTEILLGKVLMDSSTSVDPQKLEPTKDVSESALAKCLT